MEIRLFEKEDAKQVAELLSETVKIVNIDGYSETQVRTQTPDNLHFKEWEELCLKNYTIIAELNQKIIGVAQLENNGHINCFYCHADFRRKGLGGLIYSAIEEHAMWKNIPTVFTETNLTDHPFFLKMGFQDVQKQRVLIRGEVPTFYVMKKDLSKY